MEFFISNIWLLGSVILLLIGILSSVYFVAKVWQRIFLSIFFIILAFSLYLYFNFSLGLPRPLTPAILEIYAGQEAEVLGFYIKPKKEILVLVKFSKEPNPVYFSFPYTDKSANDLQKAQGEKDGAESNNVKGAKVKAKIKKRGSGTPEEDSYVEYDIEWPDALPEKPEPRAKELKLDKSGAGNTSPGYTSNTPSGSYSYP